MHKLRQIWRHNKSYPLKWFRHQTPCAFEVALARILFYNKIKHFELIEHNMHIFLYIFKHDRVPIQGENHRYWGVIIDHYNDDSLKWRQDDNRTDNSH